jgi:hypothetical protein
VKSLQTRLSRRHFLLAATTAAVAGAAAMTARKNANPASERAGTSHQAGYQVTEHVRNYYRTTRI